MQCTGNNNMTKTLQTLAERYGVSVGAVQALAQALHDSHGRAAQFNHPELGGMGQWMPGMVMVGDMFNTALKARVNGLCTDLLALMSGAAAGELHHNEAVFGKIDTEHLAEPDAMSGEAPTLSGAQNDLRYAYFARVGHLRVQQGDTTRIYNVKGRTISGLSTQNGRLMAQINGQNLPVDQLPLLEMFV
jgi:hypothetical protein